MAHAYTPELRVAERQLVRKERLLPIPGDVLARPGDRVAAEDIVARTELPGDVDLLNVAHKLSIPQAEVPAKMLKDEGDAVTEGEMIAKTSSFFGLFKSNCTSPSTGVIERISAITGQVTIRRSPRPVEVTAYVDGKVGECVEGQGVIVETVATFIQGILGVGRERVGQLKLAVQGPDDILDADGLDASFAGKIAVGGSLVTRAALERAGEVGVAGVVVGGANSEDIDSLLGYPLGVAITGQEDTDFSVVLTEGFGRIRMAARTFDLLKLREGEKASMDGSTQIRAGVIRPEVVVPYAEVDLEQLSAEETPEGVALGDTVRIIREPNFGQLARVLELPPELTLVESEALVRVVKVETEDGRQVTLPRANIEVIR